MSILLPSRSLYQPQGAARINWDNPITRGLVNVVLPGTPNHRDLIGGATDTAQYRAPVGGGSRGRALLVSNPSLPWSTLIAVSHVPGGYAALTTFCLYEPLDTTTTGEVFGAGLDTTYHQTFFKNSDGTVNFSPSTNSGGLGINTPALAANKAYALCGVARYTENFRELYVDGLSVGTNTVNGTRLNSQFAFLGSVYAGGRDRCLRMYAFYCWTRELSATEIRSLTENPWQIFQPQQRNRVHHIDFGSAPTTGWTYHARQEPNQQPSTPVVNSGHPLADGLMAWQTGTASSGFTEAGTVSTPVVSTAHGFARRFAADINIGVDTQVFRAQTRTTFSTACTLAALVRVNAAVHASNEYTGRFLGVGQGTGGLPIFVFAVTATTWGFAAFTNNPSLVSREVTAPYTTGDESWHFVVGRQSTATYRDIWVDGVKGNQDTVSCNPINLNLVSLGGYTSNGNAVAEFPGDIALALVWNRGLTDNEIRSLSRNPWQLFQQTRRIHAGTKIYRPYSDITTAGWTARPDAPYFRQLAETVPSDSNYIFSPDPSGSPGAFVAGLNASMEAGTYNIKFRARKTTSAGQIRATLLDASGSSVGASGWISLTTGFADYTATVTSSAPAARIKLEVQP